jgi:hypothetical protein
VLKVSLGDRACVRGDVRLLLGLDREIEHRPERVLCDLTKFDPGGHL